MFSASDELGMFFRVEKGCLAGVLILLLLRPMKCRRGIISDPAHKNTSAGRQAGGAVTEGCEWGLILPQCPLDCFEVSVRRANIKNQIPQSKIQYGNNNQ